MADLLRRAFERYEKNVSGNPDMVGQIESSFRILSYFPVGRFTDGQVLSELMYSASNLLVLMNDMILQQGIRIVPKVPLSQERLMRLITVLEYVEVFVEMAARKLWGNIGCWFIITVIQIIKSTLRLLLLIWYKAGIQPTPPIAPLDRDLLCKHSAKQTELTLEDIRSLNLTSNAKTKVTFVLKRSKRMMRTLSAAPPPSCRTWKLPENEEAVNQQEYYPPSSLNRQRLCAESLHIVRPVAHSCIFMARGLGNHGYCPVSLTSSAEVCNYVLDDDLFHLIGSISPLSMCMMGETEELNSRERRELRRRVFTLLYYLFRSPFYDRYSHGKILLLLKLLADYIPGLKVVANPLMEYLPVWQKVYFYIWST